VLAWRLFFVEEALSIHLAAQLLDDLAKVGSPGDSMPL
jgi:hypothetical protein